jgi:glycosyltransferase involved in cell wall biosynthesis
MLRILHINNRFNLGGPTHNVAFLARYMPPGFETLLIGGPPEGNEESSSHILSDLGVDAMILPEMRRAISPFKDLSAYRRVKQVIKDFRPDVVHTHAAKAGAVGRMAASELGVKGIVHTFHGHVFHSYFGPVRTGVFKNLERYLANKSSRIIAISDRQKAELVDDHRICTAAKVDVIPLGIDLYKFKNDQAAKRALFRRVYGVTDDEFAIGIVGRLVPVKNHALFLKGLHHVKDRSGKKIRAFIVGDGEERQFIQDRASELGFTMAHARTFNGHSFGQDVGDKPIVPKADITFTSWVKDIDIVHAGLDAVALTSFNEGTPVSLIEAQAAGRAIVSTRVGGIENVVKEGVTALLSANNNAEKFGMNLLRVVEDRNLRTRMAEAGWAHVHDRYHYTRLVEDTAKLYRALTA